MESVAIDTGLKDMSLVISCLAFFRLLFQFLGIPGGFFLCWEKAWGCSNRRVPVASSHCQVLNQMLVNWVHLDKDWYTTKSSHTIKYWKYLLEFGTKVSVIYLNFMYITFYFFHDLWWKKKCLPSVFLL